MTPRIAVAFDTLLESAPPDALLSSIHHLFYHYQVHQHPAPKNFPVIAAHLYELVQFLELAHEEYLAGVNSCNG